MNRRPIFFFTRVLPVYRIPILQRLNERLENRLVVFSGQAPGASSLGSLMEVSEPAFRHVAVRNFWLRGEALHMQPFCKAFRVHGPPAVVLAEESPRSLSLPLLLRHTRKQGIPRVLWGHFSSNARTFSPTNWQDRYRLRLARSAEACVCYTEGIRDVLRPYIPEERLFVARNTLDMDLLFSLHDRLAAEGKPAVRQRLKLPPETPVLLFIGRLLPQKGLNLLLKTFATLRATDYAALVIIGDGPERAALEQHIADQAIPDVRLLGPLTDWADSAPYLYAADVMVNPGALGLSVNHAFAFGVPVVSCQSAPGGAGHGPEVAYVIHGKNGMLCAPNDVAALRNGIEHVLTNQSAFSTYARHYARTHLTLPIMMEGLVRAIQFAEGTS